MHRRNTLSDLSPLDYFDETIRADHHSLTKGSREAFTGVGGGGERFGRTGEQHLAFRFGR